MTHNQRQTPGLIVTVVRAGSRQIHQVRAVSRPPTQFVPRRSLRETMGISLQEQLACRRECRFWTDRHTRPILILVVTLWASGSVIAGDQGTFFQRLAAPRSAVVDGQPFRHALESITAASGVNLWLDRCVDPTTPVSAGPLGPTTISVLKKLASSRDCTLMPIAGVVLVGRAEWVDHTAAALAVLELDADREFAVTDVAWADLTTPTEALQIAAGSEVDLEPPLPHDLWPAVDWRHIDRRVAVTLILAQFDRRPRATGSLARLTTTRDPIRGAIRRRYELPTGTTVFSEAFSSAGRGTKVLDADREVIATGPIAAHRVAITAWLDAAAESPKGNHADPDQSTYTIQRLETSAANALQQLAALAGRQCHIEPAAAEACRRRIALQGKDLTLRELTQKVAKAAGVTVRWQEDAILVSSGPAAKQ